MRLTQRNFIVLLATLFLLLSFTPAFSQTRSISELSRLSESFVDLTTKVSPTVVKIVVTNFGPLGESSESGLGKKQGGGSGVIVDSEGFIITNAHVVAEATKIQVVLPVKPKTGNPRQSILKPEGKLVEAQLIAVDSETDLAVLKVDATDLPYLKIGDSDKLRQGELVFAFGSPLGLENSVTMGIVSAVARTIPQNDRMVYIQTDAPINPGNSGGPLVNTNGELIGVNSFIYSQSGGNEGLGFAAPGNIVSTVYKQLRQYGTVRRGQIGINAQTITETLSKGLNLSQNWGVVVSDVFYESPADRAGLKVGDIILTLNGKVMENGRQFNVNLYGRNTGEMVTLVVKSGSQEREVSLPVIVIPDNSEKLADLAVTESNQIPKLGVVGLDNTESLQRILGPTRSQEGVIVVALTANAFLYEEKLNPGDVIISINQTLVSNLESVKSEIAKFKTGTAMVLQIERRGVRQFVSFELQ